LAPWIRDDLLSLVNQSPELSLFSKRMLRIVSELYVVHAFFVVPPHVRIASLDVFKDSIGDGLGADAIISQLQADLQDFLNSSVADGYLPVLGDFRNIFKNVFEEGRVNIAAAKNYQLIGPPQQSWKA